MEIDRIKREKVFHNDRFQGDDELRKNAKKYYSVNKNITIRFDKIISKYCHGKKLLEYGCGTGNSSTQWLEKGAILTGIDISEEGINKAKDKILKTHHGASYFVMDAEKTTFEDSSFDIVVGSGIIHHLDLLKSYAELRRILNKTGHAVFIEPLDHNPIIKLYRKLTPEMRTIDEHPLKISDIELLRNYFHNIEVEYFSLFTMLAVPFRNYSFFNTIYNFLGNLDKFVFRSAFIRKNAWTVIIHASNPKNIIGVS